MNLDAITATELWRRTSYLFSRFNADRCSENAAALTYMSLFALVPLLTVVYTMASAVPAFQGLEEKMQAFMFENLMPDTNSEIRTYLDDFSRQAKNLTGPGIIFLVVTAVLMLRNVEKAFNQIWRASENRSPVSSFLLYWAVLSLAPITIGLALALSTYLSSFAHVIEVYDVIGVKAFLLQVAPLALSTIGFSLIYIAVPNCRVPFKHCIIGGFVAAMAFHFARSVFTKLVVGSSYTFIYGAFAAVPLFLLWIYLSWNIVLMGGILVHSMSAYQNEEQAGRPLVLKALDVLYLFWQRQETGETVSEIELLNRKHEITRGLDSGSWQRLREVFLEKKLIAENDRGQYLLSRDLHTITFSQLKEWVNTEYNLAADEAPGKLAFQQEAYRMMQEQRRQQRDSLGINLVELFSK
ncbi:MAG: YihY family inner membrane protein [Pseudomonadales bacterium]|nr:YihY family inner membrane protein [Halioglobus sp.]MCP5131716.1 YihY family inner membrane protein [Pseudomonadales bacterium]